MIDYQIQDVTKLLKDFDAVFDTAGKETSKLFAVLRKGGKLVSMAGKPDEAIARRYEVTAVGQMTAVSNKQLERLAYIVDHEKIKVVIDKKFSFVDVKKAFEYFETQHPKGKIVVEIA